MRVGPEWYLLFRIMRWIIFVLLEMLPIKVESDTFKSGQELLNETLKMEQ